MSEEFEVGQELDRALRSAVTGLAQLMERHARSRADRDREGAAQARQEWLEQRDTARRQYVPWTRPGAVETGDASQASRAWAAAAAWSTMDPLAKEAEAALAARVRETYGEHPSVLLQRTDPARLPEQEPAKRLLTMPEAVELAEKHAPYYYSHPDVTPTGDLPSTPVEERYHADWQHFAENGELPERTRWEAWAASSGMGAEFAEDNWRTPDGEVDHASRDAALIRAWDEGAEERGLRELEEHQVAMATAGMDDLRTQVSPADSPDWQRLLDAERFAQATPDEVAQAWRDARAQGVTGDLAAQAGAAQLADQIKRAHGVDPAAYLLDSMTERAANHAESRRTAEDRARRTAEAVPVSGLDGAGESIALAAQQPATSPEAGVSRARVLELNTQAQEYFASQLRPGSAGQKYLVDRLGEGVMQGPWSLGYAPPGWTRLTEHLRTNGATNEEILEAGLGRMSSRGNVIDAFRDRAMVGIRSPEGDLVGFVGRDLSGDERAPKYVNTGSTAAFHKSEQIFGLSEAPEAARLVRTEGPFDAMAISLAGDGQAVGVAPLGTAMTPTQAGLLAERSTEGRVWLANDSDAAGRAATEDDFFSLARHGVDARTVEISQGDPAEAWREEPTLLRSTMLHLDEAPSAGEAVLDRHVDLHRSALAEGQPDAQRELEAAGERISEAMTDPVEAQLITTRAGNAREELVRRSDDARAQAVDLDVAGDRLRGRADTVSEPAEQARLDADAAAVEARADVTDARGDRLENRSAAMGGPDEAYDRAAESNLGDLDEPARTARVDSSHGYTKPTGEMVRGTVRSGRSGPAARPNRGRANRQGRGRGLGR